MKELVEKYHALAGEYHSGQKRKYSGEPYFVHPVAVYLMVASVEPENVIAQAAALGHDIYEDCLSHLGEEEFKTTILAKIPDELKEDAEKVNKIIIELSNVYTSERYPDLNRATRKELERERLKGISPDAATVKLADIIDNTRDLMENDPGFARKYLQEKRELMFHLTHGNRVLWKRAKNFLFQS